MMMLLVRHGTGKFLGAVGQLEPLERRDCTHGGGDRISCVLDGEVLCQ